MSDQQKCLCEHGAHFDGLGHTYRAASAGARRAAEVGPVCDECAAGHMAPYLVPELPQSELGGLHPELLARITAAKAALGDFARDDRDRADSGAMVDYISHAHRLAAELRGILEVIERHPS